MSAKTRSSHLPSTSTNTAAVKSRSNQLQTDLKLRLAYAAFKVQHGWTSCTLSEVENLFFKHFRTQQLARDKVNQAASKPIDMVERIKMLREEQEVDEILDREGGRSSNEVTLLLTSTSKLPSDQARGTGGGTYIYQTGGEDVSEKKLGKRKATDIGDEALRSSLASSFAAQAHHSATITSSQQSQLGPTSLRLALSPSVSTRTTPSPSNHLSPSRLTPASPSTSSAYFPVGRPLKPLPPTSSKIKSPPSKPAMSTSNTTGLATSYESFWAKIASPPGSGSGGGAKPSADAISRARSATRSPSRLPISPNGSIPAFTSPTRSRPPYIPITLHPATSPLAASSSHIPVKSSAAAAAAAPPLATPVVPNPFTRHPSFDRPTSSLSSPPASTTVPHKIYTPYSSNRQLGPAASFSALLPPPPLPFGDVNSPSQLSHTASYTGSARKKNFGEKQEEAEEEEEEEEVISMEMLDAAFRT